MAEKDLTSVSGDKTGSLGALKMQGRGKDTGMDSRMISANVLPQIMPLGKGQPRPNDLFRFTAAQWRLIQSHRAARGRLVGILTEIF